MGNQPNPDAILSEAPAEQRPPRSPHPVLRTFVWVTALSLLGGIALGVVGRMREAAAFTR
jgi:hypothetical protein